MKSLIAIVASLALAQTTLANNHTAVLPAELSKADLAGQIFERSDMTETTLDDGHVTLDVTSLLSSDKKFASGMYKSGKTRVEVNEPYGVDEFMYFLEGGITLTSERRHSADHRSRRGGHSSKGMDGYLRDRRVQENMGDLLCGWRIRSCRRALDSSNL